MGDELKPCPFCGGEAELHESEMEYLLDEANNYNSWVRCSDCEVEQRGYLPKDEAISAWNKRV